MNGGMIHFSVTLPIKLTNGNDGRGSKWFRSSNVRKKIEKVLMGNGELKEVRGAAMDYGPKKVKTT